MSAELDSLIYKSKAMETQIEQLTEELSRLRAEIAARMGDTREYYGHGVGAKKWEHVRWEIDKELLLDELPTEALDYLKEVVLTKAKLDQAVRAGYLTPRLYDRAIKRQQLGWNISLKIPPAQEHETDWEKEE
jgi:hypothetical protein